MYNLFTKKADSSNSVIKPPGFELIRRVYQRELATVVDYYNSRVFATKSNHILCRLLTTGYVPIEYPLDRYMEVAYARSPYLGKYFNLTSELGYGKVFDGLFYGTGNDEIILYNEDYFNPFEALDKWSSQKPVTVLEHPISDFALLLPDGEDKSSAKGLCVISINIPLLLVMYRGFLFSQANRIGQSQLGVEHFVKMYVLPGMLQSHLDIVLLNRLKNLFYGAPMSRSLKRHPFLVVDYADKVDYNNKVILKHLENSGMLYSQYLKNIPSFFEEDIQEFLIMPDMAKTQQVWWALILTRLGTIKFLIDLGGERGLDMNTSYINKIQIEIRQLNRQNVLNSVLPIDLAYDTEEIFTEISELK